MRQGPLKTILNAVGIGGLIRRRRNRHRGRQIRRGLAELKPHEVGRERWSEAMSQVREGWNNGGWAAENDYFIEIARTTLATGGRIVECGSGLTSLVLARLIGQSPSPRQYDILEHNVEWLERVRRAGPGLFNVKCVNLLHAPLVSHADFDWYDVSCLPTEPKISVLICDGPPGGGRGGRYGALPVLRDRLASGALIFFDDADKPHGRETIKVWAKEFGVETQSTSESGRFVVLRMPGSAEYYVATR